MFSPSTEEVLYISRVDSDNPLSSYSPNAFELDDHCWPTVEHYYQGMKFSDPILREQIVQADDAKQAKKLAQKYKKSIRKDWKSIRVTIMTRGLYIMFKTHSKASNKLLSTGSTKIIENSQYDYYWGCGRDLRGNNTYGLILMDIRNKLSTE